MDRNMGRAIVITVAAAATILKGGIADAQDAPVVAAPEKSRVSGSVGTEVSTHFVSYGTDIWGAGDRWSRPSVFAFTEVSIDFDHFDVTTGLWGDLRESDESTLGGPIAEIDWYLGIGKDFGRARIEVAYQAWMYPIDGEGQTEEVLDLVIGFDDSDLIAKGFALNPTFVAHTRLSGGGAEDGTALVVGIEPGHTFLKDSDYPISLSIPAEVAFGVNDFYNKNGFGYAAVGVSAGVPLSFVPSEYGNWKAGANLTYYMTDEDAIGNPKDNFLTGLVGIYLNF